MSRGLGSPDSFGVAVSGRSPRGSVSDALSLLSVFCSLRPSGEDRPPVAGQVHLAEIHDSLLHHDGPVQKGKAGRHTWALYLPTV